MLGLQMKPSQEAKRAAAITLSKGKMFEYDVPLEEHLEFSEDLDFALQFPLAIGTLGNAAGDIVSQALQSPRHERETQVSELLFAAQVLVGYVESREGQDVSGALRLLAAGAFYLADSPGTATSLIKDLGRESFGEHDFLERAVRFSLASPWSVEKSGVTDSRTAKIVKTLREHFQSGLPVSSIIEPIRLLRTWSYHSGTSHELLLSDLLCAIALKRFERSAWTCLPDYSNLRSESWADFLARPSAIKEMWPSQRMLGSAGLYRGESAVVQMPTSAGKTRATELILRSAFNSGRTKLALLVAPFRALCQEIAVDFQRAFQNDGVEINQLSDAMQTDSNSELSQWLELDADPKPHVVILTPEKLLYLLRQEDAFFANVGVVIYDEGHQFDSVARGTTYELLLTSIKRLLPKDAQTLLISAVITNAEELAKWLLGSEKKVVSNKWLQTRRLVAFASFPKNEVGQLRFNSAIEGEQDFVVPGVMPQEILRTKIREKARHFPTSESGSVALYLGLKLFDKGGVAIYVAKPASASKLVRDCVNEVFGRGLTLTPPSTFSDPEELVRIVKLFELNFGEASWLTKAAELGIFIHHGDTPHGIRLVVEHAMRQSHIKFIVCTSTLAQGVNLPIRYLLVTSASHGRDAISAKDFHNLIGRAGRAGMYDEGTVIFTDHELYDIRDKDDKKWKAAQLLLKSGSAAATSSALLRLCQPLASDSLKRELAAPSALELVLGLLTEPDETLNQFNDLDASLIRRGFSQAGLKNQLQVRQKIIEVVESFLMDNRGNIDSDEFIDFSRELGRETFAYEIGDHEQKANLERIFGAIAGKIERLVPEVERQVRYGKTLFGVDRSQEIDTWVRNKMFELQTCVTSDDLVDVVWEFLESLSVKKIISTTFPKRSIYQLGKGWLKGERYEVLLNNISNSGAYVQQGGKRFKFTIDTVANLCEQIFGYEFTLYLAGMNSAFCAFSGEGPATDAISSSFDLLQKRIKYGLPDQASISYFELGFSDRVIAQRISKRIPESAANSRHEARKFVRRNHEFMERLLDGFPSFFKEVLARTIR